MSGNTKNEAETVGGSVTEELPKGRTLGQLIDAYQTDKVSTYHKLRYHVRKNHETILRRIKASHGHIELSTVKHRHLVEWHMDWSANGKLYSAHSLIGQIRVLCNFGASMLEDEQCERIAMVLHRMKFPHAPASIERLTLDHANAIRVVAREHFGWPSMALAQAIQFELLLRQKDVIGEWVPESEPGETDVHAGDEKWLRGLRWNEINDDLVLIHKTSKKQKDLQIDLRLAPLVVEEFNYLAPGSIVTDEETGQVISVDRSMLPTCGPIVLCDVTGLPWTASEFRRKWRLVANQADVPKNVRNMDSRAGGITEATEAGAEIEHVKHAATHSDISQTQRYSRGATEKIAEVQKKRSSHRFRRSG